jgi:site-specific DNA recombinase
MADGIERQRERCTAITVAKGWTVVGTYEDNDVSATSERGAGTAWARMLADIEADKLDVVVALDMDRLLRTMGDLNTLVKLKVGVITVDGDIDLTSADGEFRATMLTGIARFEGRRKAERQIRANAQRNARGEFFKGGVRLTGYTMDGQVLETPHEAPLVRRIFTDFNNGETLRGISRALAAEGVPPRRAPSVRKVASRAGREPVRLPDAWPPTSIRSILTNPRYAGRASLGGKATGVAGTWEALVDDATFDAAQTRLADPSRKRNQGSTARAHFGSGLWRCSICDRTLTTTGRVYTCPTPGHVSRTMSYVDEYVREVIQARLAQPDIVQALAPVDDLAVLRLSKAAVTLRTRLERYRTDYAADLLDGEEYRKFRDDTKAELLSVENERLRLIGGTDISGILGAADPVAAFNTASSDRQRTVVDALVTVHLIKGARGTKGFDDNSVTITWKGDAPVAMPEPQLELVPDIP